MRKILENPSLFSERRQLLASRMAGSVLICASPREVIRNGTVPFPFRQDSNLYYLTGFEEPESVLVFCPGRQPETVLFVRPKDPSRETWDGFRFGPEAAGQEFGIDQTYPIEEFEKRLPGLLKVLRKSTFGILKMKKLIRL